MDDLGNREQVELRDGGMQQGISSKIKTVTNTNMITKTEL